MFDGCDIIEAVITISKKGKQKNPSILSPYVQFEHGDLTLVDDSPSYGHDSAQGSSSKPYVLKIKDVPTYAKPREKLLATGPTSLNLTELLALILVTGTKKEDVLSMSSRIVHEYGKSALSSSHRSAADLARDLDLPLTKACQIIACGELGRRLFNKNLSGLAVIRTPEDVYEYTKDMHTLPKEHLRGLYLDTHHKVIHDEVLSIGTINASMIHPREVFKPALEYGAAAIILVHNHPSGISNPSEADITITEQIVVAGKVLGVRVLDHVVVTRESFASIPAAY